MNTKNQPCGKSHAQCVEADRLRIQTGRISRFGNGDEPPKIASFIGRNFHRALSAVMARSHPGYTLVGVAILRVMEESLKERSAVIRVQVPLAIGAFLLNEKRSDLAEMKNTRPTVIIPNSNLQTPHYLVERLRDDHVEDEGEIPSYVLSVTKSGSRTKCLETALPQHPQAAVKTQIQNRRPQWLPKAKSVKSGLS